MNLPTSQRNNQIASLESRLAARLSAGLSEQAAALPHDIGERLRVAREQAVRRARESRQPALASQNVVVASHGATLSLGNPSSWWIRAAAVFPLLLLVAGLLLIDQWTNHQQVLAAAEIDAVLLADDLPPTAYTDPGFREFLKAPPP